MRGSCMKPAKPSLYASVKRSADAKFSAPTSAYKSAWIVREYKKRGGTYAGKPPAGSTGLKRWFKEEWVNVSKKDRPACGRTSARSAYPLCRPTKRVTKNTPATVQELSASRIQKALRKKKVVKGKGRVEF